MKIELIFLGVILLTILAVVIFWSPDARTCEWLKDHNNMLDYNFLCP